MDSFDFTTMMRPSPVVLVLGKRNAGKTTLVRDILGHLNPEKPVVFAPPNEGGDVTRIYDDVVQPIFEEYDPNVVEAIVNGTRKDVDVVVLDDCIFGTPDSHVQNLFYNGRQHRVALVMTQSRPTLPPCLRANADYVFILGDQNRTNRLRIYAMHADRMFPTFEAFCETMDTIDSRGCLVLDLARGGVFSYKASIKASPTHMK